MENVTFPHSFQTLTCDVFPEVVALFLAGSVPPSRHSGRWESWEWPGGDSVSRCVTFENSGWAQWPRLFQRVTLVVILPATANVPNCPHYLLVY